MPKKPKSVASMPAPDAPAPAVTPAAEPPPTEAPAKANRQMLLWLIIPAILIVVGVIVDQCRG